MFYRYCNDDVKESLYKSHRRTHHSSHTQKCPKNGFILKFKDKCICLRDARHNQFQDFLLGLMQTNTSLGPVYFTCYPNLELDCMNDKSIHKVLTLSIQTQNYDMDPRSRNILIVYRVYYKVMTSVVNPNCLLTSPKDQTLIWKTNEKNSTVIIPKPIPWECLTQSNE